MAGTTIGTSGMVPPYNLVKGRVLVPCDTQEEIDYFWEKLSADPKAEQCGWLKDKYGLSWQIASTVMQKFLDSSDRARIDRVTRAFLKMKKFDIAALERAAAG